MKKSSIVIVENDPTVVSDLQSRLPQIGCDVVAVFSEVEKACNELKDLQPELVLVNLDLNNGSDGMEAATRIREVNDLPVVYLTNSPNPPMLEKSRSNDAYGYIVNPFQDNEARAIIDTAILKHTRDVAHKKERDLYLSLLKGKREEKYIFIKSDFKIRRIELEDICFIEALKDYIAIHTFDQVYTTHSSMKDILKTLPDQDFVRIHRSFIVRINKIFSIKYPELLIEGTMEALPMGGLYKRDVYERLHIL